MTRPNYNVRITYGLPWLSLLGIIFIVLKVLEVGMVATWSWWLVLLPFYIGFAVVIAFFALFFAGSAVLLAGAYICDLFISRKRKK